MKRDKSLLLGFGKAISSALDKGFKPVDSGPGMDSEERSLGSDILESKGDDILAWVDLIIAVI